MVSDVVACEEDNVVKGDSLLDKQCICVVGICLMPIVIVTTGTGDDDCPIFGEGARE